MKLFHHTYLLLICCALSQFCHSQPVSLKFKRLSTDDGLPQNSVNCILKDNRGFMWFGTSGGLARYDGHRFYTYKNDVADSLSIGADGINCLYQDSRGNLWVGTDAGGLSLYDEKRDAFVTFREEASEQSISNDGITSIAENSSGNLWIGTYWGLNLLDTKTMLFQRFYNSPDNGRTISHNTISAVAVDRHDNVWVATDDFGLNYFDSKTFESTRYSYSPNNPAGLTSNQLSALYLDSSGNLWIATLGGDLMRLTDGQFYHNTFDDGGISSAPGNAILSIEETANGNIWVGVENNGLFVSSKTGDSFNAYHGLNKEESAAWRKSITALYHDNHGILWAGTSTAGVIYIDDNDPPFRHYQTSVPMVNAFAEDDTGRLWIGTDGGGIDLLLPGAGSVVPAEGSFGSFLNNDVVVSLMRDISGRIWTGTFGGGVNLFTPQTGSFSVVGHCQTDVGRSRVYALLESPPGTTWVGTLGGGINLLDNSTGNSRWFVHDEEDTTTLGDNYISSFSKDQDNRIWIGTFGDGVNEFVKEDSSFLRYYSANSGLSNNLVAVVFVDSRNRLWAGTMGGGLNLYDPESKKFIVYREKDGLVNDFVSGIEEDAHGHLWISTYNGISRFDPERKLFTSFNKQNGLLNAEFRRGASITTSQGEIAMGSTTGFVLFHPDSIKPNPAVPPVAFTGFQIYNKPILASENGPLKEHIVTAQTIELSHEQNHITFEFAALNYTAPTENVYAFKLENFDNDWNYVGNEHKATYTNLDAGNYTFRVKAANNSGVWNEQGASISISISPPFWKTWWFRLAGVAALAGAVLYLYKTRIALIQKQNVKLGKLVEERTFDLIQRNKDLEQFTYIVSHNLRAPVANLIGISSILHDLKPGDGDYKELLTGLSGSVHLLDEVIADLNEILQVRKGGQEKKEAVNLTRLVANVKAGISSLIDKEDARIVTDFSEANEILSIKGYLHSIFHNLISNGIKYRRAEAPPVIEIKSRRTDDYVELRFKDNGMGIDLKKKGRHIFGLYKRFHEEYAEGKGVGLYMVKTQVEALGGTIFIESEVGKGSVFIIQFYNI